MIAPLLVLLAGCRPADTARVTLPPREAPADAPGEPEVEGVGGPCDDPSLQGVVLNEIAAANVGGLADAAGEHPDWLELRNRGEAAAELAGWALEDESGETWPLPAVRLEPEGFLLVFASGEAQYGDELHASFALSAGGGRARLIAPAGCAADEVAWERIHADTSLGRAGAGAWEHFLEPTPGAANAAPSRPGFAPAPRLSPAAGVYGAVTVEITGEADEVRYTLDGSVPGPEDPLYTGPFALEPAADRPLVPVRAVAFAAGLWPSPPATASYGEDPALLEPGLLTLSLVADPPDLWSAERGIYAYGDPADYEPSYPYFGANFWEDWERAVHVDVLSPDGAAALSQEAGIQIHGGYSRAFDQRGLRLLARAAYGAESFAYPFFAAEDIDEYQALVLHNGGDWCATHLLDAFAAESFRDADGRRFPAIDAQAWEPVLVYLNGEFWGVYSLRERLDEHFIAAHHGADPDALDRVELGWTHNPHWELEQGDWAAFDALNAYIGADLADPVAWAEFTALVDVESLASVLIAQAYIGNSDFWYNNLRLWRPRSDGGRWRWMFYDAGHGWPSASYDPLATTVGWSGEGLPAADALDNPTFRALLALQLADYLNTALSAETAGERLEAMAARVAPAMPAQMARWCGGTGEAWEASLEPALAFVAQREDALRQQALAALGLPGLVTLSLAADPPGSGRFQLTVIEVDGGFTGEYFQGVPLAVTAEPAAGWAFAGWSDPALGAAATAVLPMDADTAIQALFSPK